MMRVLITREMAEPLFSLLHHAGAEPVHLPLIELVSTNANPPSLAPDVVLVTSASVVRFVPNLAEKIGQARVVAVGDRTKKSLEMAGVSVTAVGCEGGVSAVALASLKAGETAWYVGAEEPSIGLDEALRQDGWLRWSVYRNVPPHSSAGSAVQQDDVDIVTFASGSSVRAYVELFGTPSAPVVVIGPST
ncbi:MAG: hypothetical protein CL930_09450, partial [Deltaproteobacteria bacterium]|nr:hypothetical protein [Deltaproteobacteria bacterium]